MRSKVFPERKFNIAMGNSKCKRKFRFFYIFFSCIFYPDLARFLPKEKPLLLHNQEGHSLASGRAEITTTRPNLPDIERKTLRTLRI